MISLAPERPGNRVLDTIYICSTSCSFIGNHLDRCDRKSPRRISPPATRTSPAVIVMWYFAKIVYEYTKTVIIQWLGSDPHLRKVPKIDARFAVRGIFEPGRPAKSPNTFSDAAIANLSLGEPDSVHSMPHLSFQQAIVREKNRYGDSRVSFINRRMILDLDFVSKHWQDSSGKHLSHRALGLLYHFKSSPSFKALPKQ